MGTFMKKSGAEDMFGYNSNLLSWSSANLWAISVSTSFGGGSMNFGSGNER